MPKRHTADSVRHECSVHWKTSENDDCRPNSGPFLIEREIMPLVLIAIDDSPQAEAAFRFYVKNLHKSGNRLLLVHAAPIPHMTSHTWTYVTEDTWQAHLQPEKEKATRLVRHYEQLIKEYGIGGRIKWFFKHHAGESIVSEAKENQASLIVMGTRGMDKLHRLILGSVSDYVLHEASCPVTIVRPKKVQKDGGATGGSGGGEPAAGATGNQTVTEGTEGELATTTASAAAGATVDEAEQVEKECEAAAERNEEHEAAERNEEHEAAERNEEHEEAAEGAEDDGEAKCDKAAGGDKERDALIAKDEDMTTAHDEEAHTEDSPLTGSPNSKKKGRKCSLS